MGDIDANKIAQLDGSLLLVLRELLVLRRTTLVAKRLGLSQSAVSHALARLRWLFGDPLFVRRPYGLEPTRHALELAPRIDNLIRSMSTALGASSIFDPAVTNRAFRLAAPDWITTLVAPSLVNAFAKQAPHARFAFSQHLGADALSALRRDEIDVALGRFHPKLEGVNVGPLYEDHYCLIARAAHPKLRRKLTKATYRTLERVQISVSGDFRALELDAEGELVSAGRVIAAVPRFLIAFAVVAQSDAVAIAPARLARGYARNFGLRTHEMPFALAPIRVLAVRKPHPDPGAQWLVDVLQRAVEPPP